VEEISEINEEWSKAVGRAVLTFGNLEWVTYQCLGLFSTDKIFETVVSLNYAKRIDLILEILSGKKLEGKTFAKANELFSEAKAKAKIRNVFVHNPLGVGIYQDQEGNIQLKDEIRHYRESNKVYNLEDIQAFGKECEELELKIMELIGQMRKEIDSNN